MTRQARGAVGLSVLLTLTFLVLVWIAVARSSRISLPVRLEVEALGQASLEPEWKRPALLACGRGTEAIELLPCRASSEFPQEHAVEVEAALPPSLAAPGPDEWATIYADASLGELVDRSRSLVFTLHDVMQDHAQRAFDSGRFDFEVLTLDDKGRYVTLGEEDCLKSKILTPDGQSRTVRLPRDEFPEAYQLQEEVFWLMDRIEVLEKQRP